MTDPQLTKLLSDSPIQFEDWKMWDTWSPFAFNYNGSPKPVCGELNLAANTIIGFHQNDHLISYLFASDGSDTSSVIIRNIEEPILICCLSTINSAHSISELISFINFYFDNKLDIKIGVNSLIPQNLPFVFQLLELFFPPDRVVILDRKYRYAVREAWFYRNNHFNYIKNWSEIPFAKDENVLTFKDLVSTRYNYVDDPSRVLEMSEKVYKVGRHNYPVYDKVMMAKVRSSNEIMTTPGRAMDFDQAARDKLESEGIKILSLSAFEGIEHYLTTLFGAKTFITSYGGAACTNRFFLNPESNVILLGNNQYSWEYEYPSDQGDFWHLRHSHLFPVKRQTVLLYHNDNATMQDVDRIVVLANI